MNMRDTLTLMGPAEFEPGRGFGAMRTLRMSRCCTLSDRKAGGSSNLPLLLFLLSGPFGPSFSNDSETTARK